MNHFAALSVFIAALTLAAPVSTLAENARAVHLILLSGQSNLAHMDPARVFAPEVEQYFGAENVVVVKSAQRGQPIRRWYKKWKVTGNQNPNHIGDLYQRLITEAKAAMRGKSLKSVTFIWMQGESDAKERLSDHYEEAFLGILEQLKSDLGVKEINYIIGRLSDHGVGKTDWDKIRAIQQKLGEAGPHAAWVNTDDLNDDTKPSKQDDLHYSKAGYDILAKRYVSKIKEMVK
jgi:hypothetical protein